MLEFVGSKLFYMPLIYIVCGIISYIIVAKMINSVSRFNIKGNVGLDKRKTTIIGMIKNIIMYIIAIIIIIMILNLYGVNTTSIIASLGAVSVIIGLAFQDIIKDFLAGVFIIFDNEYAVGDVVKINGFTGEVVALGLKTTKIKAYSGEVMSLSNSSFTEVINYNLSNTNLVLYIPVGYDVKLEKVEDMLKSSLEELKSNNKDICKVDLLGVDSFDDSCLKYAIVIECKAMTQYGIKRQALKLIKNAFDKNNIDIPYNKLDVKIEK